MSMSKVDREFYSLITELKRHYQRETDPNLTTDRFWEAIDELKHVWRSYYEEN